MAADRMNGHKDWASIGWGQLAGWGLPAIARKRFIVLCPR